MCAHMRVSLRAGEKVQEWTLIPSPPPREGLSVHLVAILSRSRIKTDFTEAWGGIQRGRRTERRRKKKCIMIYVVTAMTFGQLWLLALCCRGDGES